MTAPTGFQRRLRAELLDLVDSRPGPRRASGGPPAAIAVLTAVAVAAMAVAVIALRPTAPAGPGFAGGTATTAPAMTPALDPVGYAVQVRNDVVEISFWHPDGAPGLRKALTAAGIRALVMPFKDDCPYTGPLPPSVTDWDHSAFILGSGSEPHSILVRPSALPARLTLVIFSSFADENVGAAAFTFWADPPSCVRGRPGAATVMPSAGPR